MPTLWTQSRTGRLRLWALLCLVWFIGVSSVPSVTVVAEDAQPAAPAAKAADRAATTTEAAPRRASVLAYPVQAHSDPLAAVVGLVLLGISIYFVALVIRLTLEFRVSEAAQTALIEHLETAIKERKFQEA